MNRYSDISVSHYNPMSMQEIFLAPAMMRKNHDDAIAKFESDRLKLDPLYVHTTEAIRLKNEMDSKINSQVEQLNKEGFNTNTTQSVSKLNREYQDLISPMGRVGQINNAKIIYNKEKEDFIKNADSQKISRDVAEKKWNEKTSNYTGFDKDNKVINVSPQGVAAFQDYGQDLSRAHSILGETVKGLSSSGHHLESDDDGNYWEVNKNGERIKSNNSNQVQSAYKSFRDKWIEHNGEGTRYSKDAELGIDENRVINDFNSMLKNSDVYKSSESANYHQAPINENKDEESDPSSIVDPEGTKTIGNKVGEYDFSNIGSYDMFDTRGNSTYDLTMGINRKVANTYKSIITDPIEQKRYEKIFENLSNKGVVNKSKGLNDPTNAQLIQKEMIKQGPITMQSRLIRADIDSNDKMFMGKKLAGAKDAAARNTLINQDAKYGLREVLSPNGEKIAKTKFGNGEGQYSLEYVGYDSPYNWRGYKFDNANEQQTMAHKAILYQKVDGKWTTVGNVPISRTHEELIDPNFKVANRIMNTYRNATLTPNDWTDFSTSDKSFKGLKVMYKTKDENGIPLQEPTMSVMTPDGSPNEYTLDVFTKYVDHLLKK